MYTQTTKWILFFTTPSFAVLIFRPDILIRIFGDKYQPEVISPIISIFAVGIFLNAVVGPNGEAMLGFGRSRSVLLYNVLSVLSNLGLNFILIPQYGLLGAAAASLCGYLLMNLLKSADLYFRNNVPVLSRESILMSAAMLVCSGALLILTPSSISVAAELGILAVSSILSLGVGVLVLWLLDAITISDKELINVALKKFQLDGR
jgi:O-antigen/teichoic acid export membrane protein